MPRQSDRVKHGNRSHGRTDRSPSDEARGVALDFLREESVCLRHVPELDWYFGYPVAVVLMVLAAALPYLFFKWKKWL